MDQPVIYILTNKANGKRYVGLARKSFARRLRSHFKNDSYIGKALRKNGLDGFDVQKVVYATEELNYWEKYFIAKLGSRFPNGYNMTDGGDGLVNPVQEVRDRIARKSREIKESGKYPDFTFEGHNHREGSKKQISETLLVTMALPEVRARMSASQKLRPPDSEETRKKKSDSKMGTTRSDAALFSDRMKEVASRPGYVNPMQDKKRPDLAERNRAGKGRKDSPETLAKKSAAQKGRPKAANHVMAIKIAKAVSRFTQEVSA